MSLLAIGLASLLGSGAASAGTLVEFPNLAGHTPENLTGYLARPDAGLAAELDGDSPSSGGGPFPAVVVLHGCIGLTGHFTGIADRLSSWGYVALAVDSLGPARHLQPLRHRKSRSTVRCLRRAPLPVGAVFRRSGAGRRSRQFDGRFAVLYAVDRGLAAQYFRDRFRAAVAFYPGCDLPTGATTMTAPTLILIGEADQASPVERCREMVAHARPDGAPIALTVYPGVHHNFDVAQLTRGVRYFDHWLEYNEAAAKAAGERVRAFLAAHLTNTSPCVGNRR